MDHAVRYPLGTKFHAVIDDLKARPAPLVDWAGTNLVLITDASGLGDVLVEELRREGLDPVGIVITAGGSVSRDARDRRVWHVARNILVDVLKHRLGRDLHVRCATDMAIEIAAEAANMQYTITSAPHELTEPRQGRHDDLLLATAMGAWVAQHDHPPPDPQPPLILFGTSTASAGQTLCRCLGHPGVPPDRNGNVTSSQTAIFVAVRKIGR